MTPVGTRARKLRDNENKTELADLGSVAVSAATLGSGNLPLAARYDGAIPEATLYEGCGERIACDAYGCGYLEDDVNHTSSPPAREMIARTPWLIEQSVASLRRTCGDVRQVKATAASWYLFGCDRTQLCNTTQSLTYVCRYALP
jgi:hypothetical protein